MKRLNGILLISMMLSGTFQNAEAQLFSRVSIAARAGYYLLPNWSDTYDVIYANNGEMAFGVEIACRITPRWEAALTVDRVTGKGERVWPDGNNGWEKTGENVTFELFPVTLCSRLYMPLQSRFTPYLGLGLGYCMFKETGGSQESGIGYLALAGVEWSVNTQFSVMLETDYSSYPGVIGTGDLSQYYDEDDVGGVSLRLSARYSFSIAQHTRHHP
jgi:opacity protein-like surface antigen